MYVEWKRCRMMSGMALLCFGLAKRAADFAWLATAVEKWFVLIRPGVNQWRSRDLNGTRLYSQGIPVSCVGLVFGCEGNSIPCTHTHTHNSHWFSYCLLYTSDSLSWTTFQRDVRECLLVFWLFPTTDRPIGYSLSKYQMLKEIIITRKSSLAQKETFPDRKLCQVSKTIESIQKEVNQNNRQPVSVHVIVKQRTYPIGSENGQRNQQLWRTTLLRDWTLLVKWWWWWKMSFERVCVFESSRRTKRWQAPPSL